MATHEDRPGGHSDPRLCRISGRHVYNQMASLKPGVRPSFWLVVSTDTVSDRLVLSVCSVF